MVQTTDRTLLDRLAELNEIWPGDTQAPRNGWPDPTRPSSLSGGALQRLVLRHRWGLAALAVLVLLAVWLLAVAAPSFGRRLADDLTAEYRSGLAEMEQALPQAQRALATLTDPSSTGEGLSIEIQALARLSAAAAGLEQSAASPLPGTPPFVTRRYLEALTPERAAAGAVAAQAGEIVLRLDRFLSYRLIFAGSLELPPLPFEAGPDEIDVLSTDMAAANARSVEAIVSLPADPLLDSHRLEANGMLVELDDFRTAYLAALRDGDAGETERLAGIIAGRISDVEASLAVSLADIEAWGVEQLETLREAIAAAAA